ncbi:MAG TPA: thioredoxin domain-containing protein [Egibacteraceae bacterium]|nr:thioredoxin domain-containing protein [Egibacteraceae bacterium]
MSGTVWVVSYVLLWLAVVVLGVAVVVLLRQIGVLHTRLRPLGVHHADRGPVRGDLAPPAGVDYAASEHTLVAFTAADCPVCHELLPSLRVLARDYPEVRLHQVDMGPATERVFAAFRVDLTPYLVLVGRDGTVLGGGVANTLEQAEVLIESARGPAAAPASAEGRP